MNVQMMFMTIIFDKDYCLSYFKFLLGSAEPVPLLVRVCLE